MRLTVIGTAGSYPGPDSSASCYLLEAEHDNGEGSRTWRLLMDLGSGALGSLQNYIDPVDVDGVLVSHLHADHCLDLCGFYVLRKYHPTGAQPRIPVWGPADTARRMAKAYDLDEDPGMNEEFDFQPYPERFTFGPFSITAREVVHPVTAYGLRIEVDGAVLAYSGDTGPCEALEETARDADVFLCEASFVEGPDNPPDLHLTGKEAGEAARRSGAKRLLVTHVPPWHEREVALAEAVSAYDGPCDIALPGMVVEL